MPPTKSQTVEASSNLLEETHPDLLKSARTLSTFGASRSMKKKRDANKIIDLRLHNFNSLAGPTRFRHEISKERTAAAATTEPRSTNHSAGSRVGGVAAVALLSMDPDGPLLCQPRKRQPQMMIREHLKS